MIRLRSASKDVDNGIDILSPPHVEKLEALHYCCRPVSREFRVESNDKRHDIRALGLSARLSLDLPGV